MTKNEAIQKALRLEEKVIDLQMHLRLSRDCTAELRAEIARLTAERDRYKTALERIEKTDPAVPDSTGPIEACEGCTEMIEIAANALKPKEAK